MASPLGETSLLKEAPIFEGELLAPDASELSVLVGALDQAEPNPDRSDDDVGWDKEEVLKSEKDVWERADKELRNIREFTDPTIEALVRLWRRQEPAAALTCLLDAADNPTNGRGPSSIASWLNVLFLQQKFTVDASYGKAVLPSQHHTLTSQALAKTYSATPKASNISVLASAEIDCMREIKRQLWDKGIGPIPEIFEVQVSDKGHLTPSDIGTKARRRMKLKEKGKCSWRRAVLY